MVSRKVINKEYYKELGKKLLKIRINNSFSQKEVANKLKITFQQYQKYETGVNRIPVNCLVAFCEITNTNINNLLSNKESIENFNNFSKKEMINKLIKIFKLWQKYESERFYQK